MALARRANECIAARLQGKQRKKGFELHLSSFVDTFFIFPTSEVDAGSEFALALADTGNEFAQKMWTPSCDKRLIAGSHAARFRIPLRSSKLIEDEFWSIVQDAMRKRVFACDIPLREPGIEAIGGVISERIGGTLCVVPIDVA